MFYHCYNGVSKRIWKELLQWCADAVDVVLTVCDDVLQWGFKQLTNNSMKATLWVYHLWKQRNDIRHGSSIITEELVLRQINLEIRSRVIAKGRFRRTSENVVLCNNWDVADRILVEIGCSEFWCVVQLIKARKVICLYRCRFLVLCSSFI